MNDQLSESQLNDGSRDLVSIITSHLSDDRGVHIETALAAAGALSGLALLRSTGLDTSAVTPGSPLFSDAVNEKGPELMGYLMNFCRVVGISEKSGWTNEIADDHKPQKNEFTLNSELESKAEGVYQKHSIEGFGRSVVAGLAGVRLLKLGEQALTPEIGKSILMFAIQAGAKTSPPQKTNA